MTNWQRLTHDAELKRKLLTREAVLDTIRQHFKLQKFHEVETPLLVSHPGTEPYLEVFETELQTAGQVAKRAFLLTSPEYALKKLLAAGLGSIFEITKSFRNAEGVSTTHNSEFTILEWYHTPGNYEDVMRDCEGLALALWQSLSATWPERFFRQSEQYIWVYQGRPYNITPPWPRFSVQQAFQDFAQIDAATFFDETKLIAAARDLGLLAQDTATYDDAFYVIFLNLVEPKLHQDRPVILYDYPLSQAALSQTKATDNRLAERFEWYMGGLELGNAFSELRDATEQRRRLTAELLLRQRLGKTNYTLDEDFLLALKQGLPPTGGIAVGVDRLVMLAADAANIQDTLFFPQRDLFPEA